MLSKMSNISIAKKITLLFTSIFVLAIVMLTITIFANANIFFSSTKEILLEEEISNVKKLILNGYEITEDSLQANLHSNNIDILVTNTRTGHVISNRAQINEQGFYYLPNNSDITKGVFRIKGFETSYISTLGKEGVDFFSKDDYVVHDKTIYRITGIIHQQTERKYIGSLATMLAILNASGFLIAVAASSFISSRILKPVEKIRQTAERISIEDLSRRIEISGPNDEIKELAITFNAMFDRLESEFKKQTQFVSDASHELRTPISVIQGYANLVSRWGKDDPAVLDEAIDSIKAETEHMTILIKKLLFLAKDQQNAKMIHKEEISLKDIVEEITRETEIMQTPQTISANIDEEAKIVADYNLIKQLLWIIVENSIKYTPSSGSITISVYKDNKYAYVSVKDTGIGIDKEEIPNIFGRFYRVDKSRNKTIEGTGLGLSIAECIVKQHNAEIEVHSDIGKGTQMIIRFLL